MCSEKVAPLGTYEEGLLEGLRKLPGASASLWKQWGPIWVPPPLPQSHNKTCRVLPYNRGRIYLHLGPVETLGSCFWSVSLGSPLFPRKVLQGLTQPLGAL